MTFKQFRRRLRWPFSFAFLASLLWLVQRLPRSWSLGLSRGAAALTYLVPSQRRLLLTNLRLAFPEMTEEQRGEVAKGSLRTLTGNFVDFAWSLAGNERLARLGRLPEEVRATYDRLKAEHGSVILLTPHFGSWEVGFQALTATGIEVAAIARRLPNPYLENLITKARTRQGARIIHEKGAAKGVYRTLRAGGTVGMLVDQNTRLRHGGLFVDFFGLPVTMSRAPAMFARRAGAALLFCPAIRQADGSVVIEAHELPKTVEEYADDTELCQAIATLTESLVRRFPEQYLWLYERWLYIPTEMPEEERRRYPFYAKDASQR